MNPTSSDIVNSGNKDSDYSAPNYVKIINWIWEEVPYLEGSKTSYCYLLLALIDSINRNFWRQDTRITIDTITNKCKMDKRTYLAGRQWLVDNGLIEFTPGKNGYQMASFNLGIAVLKCTANCTSERTTDRPVEYTAASTVERTHLIKQQTEKKENRKTKNRIDNDEVTIITNDDFDEWWDLYDKKVGKEICRKIWNKLKAAEKEKAIEHTKKYLAARPEKSFRKDPERYLKQKCFNDEIVESFSNDDPYAKYPKSSRGAMRLLDEMRPEFRSNGKRF